MPLKTTISPHVPRTGRIMITNGGAHPPEAWAQVTAEHIAPLGPDLIGQRYREALEVQGRIASALESVYSGVQTTEQAALANNSSHLSAPPDPTPHLDGAIAAVRNAVKGSAWESQFATSEAEAFLRREIGTHIATAQYIEKSWHADRNPQQAAKENFRAARNAVPAVTTRA